MKKIRKKIKKWMLVGVSGAIALAMGSVAFAGKLVINSKNSDPKPKKAMTELVEDFKKVLWMRSSEIFPVTKCSPSY